jgi:hypothetical protein
VVCPVHESAEIVPLEHTPESHAVAQADRDPFRQIDVVSNQQGLAVSQLQDESLMAVALIVIRDQPLDESRILYPTPRIVILVACFDFRTIP